MSFEQTQWVWMNGEIVPWADANVHVSSHTLHFGTGVFEGLRCYKTEDGRPAVFRMKDHIARLYESARTYGIDIPYAPDALQTAIESIIRHNRFSSCYVRVICFYGSNRLGLNPYGCPVEVAIIAWPWEKIFGDNGHRDGIKVGVSSWLKFDSRMMPSSAKACGQYVNFFLALREVLGKGLQEAILLNLDGHLAEGSGSNIFIFRDERLVTNGAGSSILAGITQDSVIKIARASGYAVDVQPLSLQDLLDAEEAFFTGTAVQIMPINEVDGKRIGRDERQAVTRVIQQQFSDVITGQDQRFIDWLHYVG